MPGSWTNTAALATPLRIQYARTGKEQRLDGIATIGGSHRPRRDKVIDALRRGADLAALNTQFHALICTLSGNALLAGIMDSLHGRLQWVYRQSAEARAPSSLAEHEHLAAAIRAADPDEAAEAAREHVQAARRTALALADGRI